MNSLNLSSFIRNPFLSQSGVTKIKEYASVEGQNAIQNIRSKADELEKQVMTTKPQVKSLPVTSIMSVGIRPQNTRKATSESKFAKPLGPTQLYEKEVNQKPVLPNPSQVKKDLEMCQFLQVELGRQEIITYAFHELEKSPKKQLTLTTIAMHLDLYPSMVSFMDSPKMEELTACATVHENFILEHRIAKVLSQHNFFVVDEKTLTAKIRYPEGFTRDDCERELTKRTETLLCKLIFYITKNMENQTIQTKDLIKFLEPNFSYLACTTEGAIEKVLKSDDIFKITNGTIKIKTHQEIDAEMDKVLADALASESTPIKTSPAAREVLLNTSTDVKGYSDTFNSPLSSKGKSGESKKKVSLRRAFGSRSTHDLTKSLPEIEKKHGSRCICSSYSHNQIIDKVREENDLSLIDFTLLHVDCVMPALIEFVRDVKRSTLNSEAQTDITFDPNEVLDD